MTTSILRRGAARICSLIIYMIVMSVQVLVRLSRPFLERGKNIENILSCVQLCVQYKSDINYAKNITSTISELKHVGFT